MIKLARPVIRKDAIADVVRVLESGNLIQGAVVQKFEEGLADYLEIKHAIVVSSGTAALHLALLALNIGPGNEVIVPAFTYPATANVVELVGARPVLVDVTLEDYCLDPRQIEAAVTKRTKAIMPVHEFGQAANMSPIMAIAKRRRLQVIEDAACALGTEYKCKKAGTIGNLGCFSFHPRKAITTGEGGAVVTNDDLLADRLRSLRNHGISGAGPVPDFREAGFNYRLTEFQAALGIPQLRKIESFILHRLRAAERYDRELSGVLGIKIPRRYKNRRMIFQTYHILLAGGVNRDAVIRGLKLAGIETNLGAQALHCLSFYRKKYRYTESRFPNAARAYRQGLALPMSQALRESDIRTVAWELRKALSRKD
jgi:perosamine synthetase